MNRQMATRPDPSRVTRAQVAEFIFGAVVFLSWGALLIAAMVVLGE